MQVGVRGGQRCPAHTRPKFVTALATVDELPPDATPMQRLEAAMALEDAACEFASTPEGAIAVPEAAALAQSSGKPERAALLMAAAERGRALREANAEVAKHVESAMTKKALREAPVPKESSFSRRNREAEEAESRYEEAQRWVAALQKDLGPDVRPCPQDGCAACGHAGHAEGSCRQSIQVMSDLWEICSCGGHAYPTEGQVRLADAMRERATAFHEAKAAQEKATSFEPGDRLVVARGRKVPRSTKGKLIRLWQGDFGTRALLRTDEGESVWVDYRHLDRLEDAQSIRA